MNSHFRGGCFIVCSKRELQSSANDWGSDPNKAIGNVTDALEEVRQAEAWARDRREPEK
jgi:hypothetical protein